MKKICPVCKTTFYPETKQVKYRDYCSDECVRKASSLFMKGRVCPHPEKYFIKCSEGYTLDGTRFCDFEGKCVIL